jgi:hypothetical protein
MMLTRNKVHPIVFGALMSATVLSISSGWWVRALEVFHLTDLDRPSTGSGAAAEKQRLFEFALRKRWTLWVIRSTYAIHRMLIAGYLWCPFRYLRQLRCQEKHWLKYATDLLLLIRNGSSK